MRRLWRWLGRLAVLLLGLALVLFLGFLVVIRTHWFREKVRVRVMSEVDRATGGKTSIGAFEFDPGTLEFGVKDFVLRGKEPESEAPLARVSSIQARVRVLSLFARRAYLEMLHVERPDIRIVIFPDGTSNIPGPKVKREGKSVFEHFVSIAARHFELKNGVFEYDNQRLPLNLLAKDLRVDFGWEAEPKRYRGKVSAHPFQFDWPKIGPLEFDSEVALTMDREGLRFERAESRRGRSLIVATGTLKDYKSPKLDVNVDGRFEMAEWVKPMKLPLAPEGQAQFHGRFTWAADLLLTGKLEGRGLAVRQPGYTVAGIDVDGVVRLDRNAVDVSQIQGRALDGTFRGDAKIRDWKTFDVNGTLAGLSLEQLRQVEDKVRPVAWSSTMSGPFALSGVFAEGGIRDFKMSTALDLKAAEGRLPLDGTVNFRWEQKSGLLAFQPSILHTPRTRVEFSGTLDDRIRVRLDSEDLNDMLPAIALASANPPAELPLQLDGGTARFDGVVNSPSNGLTVQGQIRATGIIAQKQKLDRVSATVEADASHFQLSDLSVAQNGTEVTGDIRVGLNQWKIGDEAPLSGDLQVQRVSIERLLKEAGRDLPLRGTLSGNIKLSGTTAAPGAETKLSISDPVVAGQRFDALAFDLGVEEGALEIRNGLARTGAAQIPFHARFEHAEDDWKNGTLRFDIRTKGAALASFEEVRKVREDLGGLLDLDANGLLDVKDGQPLIRRVDATVDLRQISVQEKPIGNFRLVAKTREDRMDVTAAGDLLGSPLKGSGEWQMSGDARGMGTLDFGTVTFARIRDLVRRLGLRRELPFDGSATGSAVVNGPLRKLDQVRARVTLAQLELQPANDAKTLTPAVIQELTLRSDGPIIFEMDSRGLQVQQLRLLGKETNLQLAGGIARAPRATWNMTLRGGLNLGLFQDYVPGLRTSGAAVVNATVRGTFEQPSLGGRAEIKDASVYHRDLTNGIDKAAGVITFDRNRALLQNLTAQTGGGELKLTGFVTFPTVDEPISYRVNGQADRVRIRYPEGASSTVNGNLSLTGNPSQSILSGVVTILRSGFTPRTDIGSLLLEPAKPVQTPTSSTLLRGMQFDVRVVSAPNLVLETSLTQGLQASVDMRLRGSPLKPVLLGNVSVNQGEINFFGTSYNITRGTVSFFNAARIEPVLDLDLESTVRAITVNMNVSGPIDKLNITYRSDPPLQTQDIIALLAVGRAPGSSTVAPQANVAGVGSGLYAGTNTLLGQAVSAGVTGRLQRFFGVSRVKIDPQLTGLDTTPQARLTIEQQISRDITLTYVTNLTGALQQLVRLQWDVGRNYSVIGTRDENGVIGADILFRKRFK